MKKRILVYSFLIAILLLYSPITAFASPQASAYEYTPEQIQQLADEKRIDDLQIEKIRRDVADLVRQQNKNDSSGYSFRSVLGHFGDQGDIIVSLIAQSGSIGFAGHAAIVSMNSGITIESYARDFSPAHIDGVQRCRNSWNAKTGTLLYRAKGSTKEQRQRAARYAENQIGKPYNWVFTNQTRTDSFYCSQLVWRAWLNAGIDIEEGSVPNGVVSPADLANSTNTVFQRQA